jgi:hypothetical protein
MQPLSQWAAVKYILHIMASSSARKSSFTATCRIRCWRYAIQIPCGSICRRVRVRIARPGTSEVGATAYFVTTVVPIKVRGQLAPLQYGGTTVFTERHNSLPSSTTYRTRHVWRWSALEWCLLMLRNLHFTLAVVCNGDSRPSLVCEQPATYSR